jgi:hypothetical protein
MDKVQKPSIDECYTPSSEPYRVYFVTSWRKRLSMVTVFGRNFDDGIGRTALGHVDVLLDGLH